MGIRLNIKTEPYWLDLVYGLRTFVRPLNTATNEMAKAKARRLGKELLEQAMDAHLMGAKLDMQGLPDLTDPDALEGVTNLLFIQCLAQASILKWEGVLDDDTGEPAPVTEKTVADLMHIPGVADDFAVKYTAPLVGLLEEGNASRPAPNGTLGAGLDTADGVPKTEAPAPKAGKGKGGSDAPTTNTT